MELQQFLSYFGSPLVKALKEFDAFPGKTSSFKWREHNSLDVLLELNKTEPFSIVFHPNGNFGQVNTKGKLKASKKDGVSPYINAICFDIDTKTHPIKDKTKLLGHIHDTCSLYKFQPTFIVESGGGFHVYLVIKPEDRQTIWDIYGDGIFKLGGYLAMIMGGDDKARCSMGIDGSLRLPGSYHWKTGTPFQTKIVFENTEAIYTKEMIDCAMRYATDVKKIEDVIKKASSSLKNSYSKVNQIPIKEVIQALSNHPRTYNGRAHTFTLDGNSINILYTAGGELYKTDGYKVNERENFVNCLSSTYHPIEERPRGGPYPFALYYFAGDHNKVAKFFEDYFKIKVTDKAIIDEKELLIIEKDDYSIVFTNRRVMLVRIVENAKGTNTVRKELFRTQIDVVGKTMVSVSQDFGESETPNRAYVVNINNTTIIMHRYSNKKKFNDRHGMHTFFYGEDNDLGLFYEALDYSDAVMDIQTIVHNGIYGDCTVLGGKIIDGNGAGKYLCVGAKYDTALGKPISLKNLLKMLCQAFDERIVVPAFLQMIALAGMNCRDRANPMPALLVTGRTGCGKTTLVEILKHMCGYKAKDRSYTISAVTKQPLSQYAGDSSILFLDELTSSVSKQAEELLRTIVNRDKGGRGLASGNMFFNFRSPLCVMGERTFIQESINNRFVGITMNQKYRLPGGKEIMEKCKGMTCIHEIYSKYYTHANQLQQLYGGYTERLSNILAQSRYADTWGFMFVINEIFEFGYTFDELVEMTEFHLGMMGFNANQNVSEDAQLELFLVRGMNKKDLIFKEDNSTTSTTFRFFFSSDEYYQMHRSSLNTMISQFNERFDGGNIYVSSAGITLKMNKLGATNYDLFIETIMENVTKTITDTKAYAGYR